VGARLVCNTARFAPNYTVIATAVTLLSALARPLDLLLCAAASLAAFCAHGPAFDAAWSYLHRFAVFDVAGVPLRVDGEVIKLNGHTVRNETKLYGIPKLGALPRVSSMSLSPLQYAPLCPVSADMRSAFCSAGRGVRAAQRRLGGLQAHGASCAERKRARSRCSTKPFSLTNASSCAGLAVIREPGADVRPGLDAAGGGARDAEAAAGERRCATAAARMSPSFVARCPRHVHPADPPSLRCAAPPVRSGLLAAAGGRGGARR
jgi:hypothetical protein